MSPRSVLRRGLDKFRHLQAASPSRLQHDRLFDAACRRYQSEARLVTSASPPRSGLDTRKTSINLQVVKSDAFDAEAPLEDGLRPCAIKLAEAPALR